MSTPFESADATFSVLELDGRLTAQHSELPASQLLGRDDFEALWSMHPPTRHLIEIHGREVPAPRFQQAFVHDYEYTRSLNNALPMPELLRSLLSWTQLRICSELNGLLLNWYNGPSHYIGEHHDSTKGLITDTPIVTISFGETRVFRLSKGKGKERVTKDIEAADGSVIVIPWDTNLAWKHSVPKRRSYRGRRISVTFRAFGV